MTVDIALVFGILLVSLVLFVTEKLRMDVVALAVLGTLAVTGLVTPAEAISGFSNPAVVTVWAMFIISAGLTNTSVADIIGKRILRVSGNTEARRIIVIMLISGVLSAFMNNIGVAALMLPIVLDIARKTDTSPSRLLMPMAYGTLLGGLTTLIGTPPNLLVSAFLDDNGLTPFGLFDFTPVGSVVMVGGIAFIAFIGRRWLPRRDPMRETAGGSQENLLEQYSLQERTFVLQIPEKSVFDGKTLAESRLGAAAGLSVFAVMRSGQPNLTTDGTTVLKAGDRLLAGGRLDRLNDLKEWKHLLVRDVEFVREHLASEKIDIAEIMIKPGSSLADRTLSQAGFRQKFHLNVLAIGRGGEVRRTNLPDTVLQEGDTLLVHGERVRIASLRTSEGLVEESPKPQDELIASYQLEERMWALHVPERSFLVGSTLGEIRMRDALGLHVLAIVRGKTTSIMPDAAAALQARDVLIISCRKADLDLLLGFHELQVHGESVPDIGDLKSDKIRLAEAVLLPRSALAGKTLRQLHFRAKYGLQVIAVWRKGRAYRSELRDMELSFGDALLLLGKKENLKMLGRESDFLVVGDELKDTSVRKPKKAPMASLILVCILFPVLMGWLPIAIAALTGATLMVLTNCLNMEEAYKAIDWRSIFLIAGMLPLGTAMQNSGAAGLLAESVVVFGDLVGPWGVIIALYLITALATSIIPTAALVVLMAPIAVTSSVSMGISPYAALMAIAIAASASFTSPISHPANVLVMGPGGYRFMDYVKLGIPLTLVVMVLGLAMLAVVWPL